jgi:hypothetical protein
MNKTTSPKILTRRLQHLQTRAEAQSRDEFNRFLQDAKTKGEWLDLVNAQGHIQGHLNLETGERFKPHQKPEQQLQGFFDALKKEDYWSVYSLNDATWNKIKNKTFTSLEAQAEAMVDHIDLNQMPDYWYESKTSKLWRLFKDLEGCFNVDSASKALLKTCFAGLKGWRLEKWNALPQNILRLIYSRRWADIIVAANGQFWINSDFGYNTSSCGDIFSLLERFVNIPQAWLRHEYPRHIVLVNLTHDDVLTLPNPDIRGEAFFDPSQPESLYARLLAEDLRLVEPQGKGTWAPPSREQTMPQLAALLGELDYRPARLPKLEPAFWTDPDKGLWELWGEDEDELRALRLRARNPAQDVKALDVAIDFGTSSTVVALREMNGRKTLLRIGARDFFQPVHARDFENPTVLEFRDLEAFLTPWQAETYRPDTDWEDVCAANQALEDFRAATHKPEVVRSVLMHLKRWAREGQDQPLVLMDQQGKEFTLPPLTVRPPTKGVPMKVSPEDPLDPIELYAYFLGLNINWRQRWLFLRYYLTFPVKYEREVKDAILASFARGLQRSLPASLVQQGTALTRFHVEEVATEPMAFAAAMLPHLGLEPGVEGIHYAVFDFGGGTTDFDFGLWRLANAEEEDRGYEYVFERFHAGGDPSLGGENILAHLAYRVLRHNASFCLSQRIRFSKPADAEGFAGSEALLDFGSVARANSATVMQALRPFLERRDTWTDEVLNLTLINAEGQPVSADLVLDVAALDDYVNERIENGVRLFVHEMAEAFGREFAGTVHVLLAGNASRGQPVQRAFDPQGAFWSARVAEVFARGPRVVIHPPVVADEQASQALTCKTAVALGALNLAPGKGVLQIDRMAQQHGLEGQAPFAFFVGRIRRRKLNAVLTPRTPYQQWHELGVVTAGVFDLAWSDSPAALTEAGVMEGDPSLRVATLEFGAVPEGWRVFGRITAPRQVELACAPSMASDPADVLEYHMLKDLF